MPKLCKRQSEQRLALIKERVAAGFWSIDIAKELGLTIAALTNYMSYHGIKSANGKGRPKKGAVRPSLSGIPSYYVKKGTQPVSHTLASIEGRRKSLEGMRLKADPNGLSEEERETAAKMGISPERMAYLIKCPRGGNAHGWRGGNAIG